MKSLRPLAALAVMACAVPIAPALARAGRTHQGLETKATPQALVAHCETLQQLAAVYEQLNASFAAFDGQPLDEQQAKDEIDQAGTLIDQAQSIV